MLHVFPSPLQPCGLFLSLLLPILRSCLSTQPGLLHWVSLYAVRQVSLTISATQSSEVMKHSVPRMWQEIHICLLCFTHLQGCSNVCSSEKCWCSRTLRNNCVSALSQATELVSTFFIVIKKKGHNETLSLLNLAFQWMWTITDYCQSQL